MSEKQVIWRNVDDLELWQDNPNQGDIGAIVTSINRFGYNDVVAIWNGRIQGGNHRARAIAQLYQGAWIPGDNDRMARIHEGDLQIGCLDVSHLESEQEANAFGIALNRTTRLGEDDDAKLAALLQDIAAVDDTLLTASGYDGDDLDNLLRDLATPTDGEWGEHLGDLPDGEKSPFQQITFTVHDNQAEPIREALGVAKQSTPIATDNQNSNGNALAFVCEEFLRHHGQS